MGLDTALDHDVPTAVPADVVLVHVTACVLSVVMAECSQHPFCYTSWLHEVVLAVVIHQ